jgi:hypothetical protein
VGKRLRLIDHLSRGENGWSVGVLWGRDGLTVCPGLTFSPGTWASTATGSKPCIHAGQVVTM